MSKLPALQRARDALMEAAEFLPDGSPASPADAHLVALVDKIDRVTLELGGQPADRRTIELTAHRHGGYTSRITGGPVEQPATDWPAVFERLGVDQ